MCLGSTELRHQLADVLEFGDVEGSRPPFSSPVTTRSTVDLFIESLLGRSAAATLPGLFHDSDPLRETQRLCSLNKPASESPHCLANSAASPLVECGPAIQAER